MSTNVISQARAEEAEYEVHIVGADGARQTLLGFATEADCESMDRRGSGKR